MAIPKENTEYPSFATYTPRIHECGDSDVYAIDKRFRRPASVNTDTKAYSPSSIITDSQTKGPASTRDAGPFVDARCRYRPRGPESQGPKTKTPQVPRVRAPKAELLPEGRSGEVAGGEAVPARAELHLTEVAVEVDVRHALPRIPARSRALQAREPEAEALLVVRGLDPSRVLRAHEEQGAAGRGLRVADVDGLLADVGVELDAPPRERPRLELRTVTLRVVRPLVREKAELARVRDHPVPAPLVLLSVDRPLPRELEGVLERVERRVEDDDRLGVVRVELGGLLGADPRELPEVDALHRAAGLEGREHVDGRVEHAVHEAEDGELVELAHPLLRHLVVTGELGDPLGRETEPTQTTDELDDLRTAELRSEILTGHGDLPS